MRIRHVWLVALTACASPADRPGDADAIRALNAAFADALNAGDVDALATLVTEDIVMMPPGAPPVAGVEALRSTFGSMFESISLEETWTSREIHIDGDLAYDWSGYTVTISVEGQDEPRTERGQNLFVAVRQADGTWKYSRMMWNTDGPSS